MLSLLVFSEKQWWITSFNPYYQDARPKTHPLSVEEFMKSGFLIWQGKSAGNTVCINEHFNEGKGKIRLHKSWFKQLRLGHDAWGVPTVLEDHTDIQITSVNPFLYRTYYYDWEIGMYYLQSRYYDPVVGRFINADDAEMSLVSYVLLAMNFFSYCWNSPIVFLDCFGLWAEKYSGFRTTSTGFNVNVNKVFLSKTFCLAYAGNIISLYGSGGRFNKKYKKMNAIRIAQELWSHALGYYLAKPLKSALGKLGISWKKVDELFERTKYIEVDNVDKNVWLYKLLWYSISSL